MQNVVQIQNGELLSLHTKIDDGQLGRDELR